MPITDKQLLAAERAVQKHTIPLQEAERRRNQMIRQAVVERGHGSRASIARLLNKSKMRITQICEKEEV